MNIIFYYDKNLGKHKYYALFSFSAFGAIYIYYQERRAGYVR